MPLFPGDFKKFKYKEHDENSATLIHPAGHEIRIARKAIKDPKMVEMLDAMCHGGPVKKAEGGLLASTRRSGALGTKAKATQEARDVDPQYEEKKPKDPAGYFNPKPQAIRGPASGSDDVRTPEQKERASAYEAESEKAVQMSPEEAKKKAAAEYYAGGGEVEGIEEEFVPDYSDPMAATLGERVEDPQKQALIDRYNMMAFDKMPGEPRVQIAETFGPGNEPPAEISPEIFEKAKASVEAEKNQAVMAEQQEIAKAQAVNDMKYQDWQKRNEINAQLGLPAVPMPAGVVPPQAVAAEEPQVDVASIPETQPAMPVEPQAPTGPTPEEMMQGAIGREKTALDEQAKALAQQADDTLKAQERLKIAQADAESTYIGEKAMIMQRREDLQNAINEGKIDPEKFWKNRSRLMAGIGIILSSFNTNANAPNVALKYLDTLIDRDIEAQKENLATKKSLLSLNYREMGDLNDAIKMTRLQLADQAANEISMAASKAANPLAKAAAEKAKAEIDMKYGAEFEKLSQKRTLASLKNAAMRDPNKMEAYEVALDTVDPKAAADMRAKKIPGMGYATSTEGAKDMREMQTTVKTIKAGIQRLREIAKTTGKSLSPELRAEADNIRTQLIGRLRVPLTGPGAMSEGERELLMNAIPGVADTFALDSRNLKKLETLEKGITEGYRNMAIANGLTVPQTTGNVDKRQQAMEWLKKNPNDPRANSIKAALGIK